MAVFSNAPSANKGKGRRRLKVGSCSPSVVPVSGHASTPKMSVIREAEIMRAKQNNAHWFKKRMHAVKKTQRDKLLSIDTHKYEEETPEKRSPFAKDESFFDFFDAIPQPMALPSPRPSPRFRISHRSNLRSGLNTSPRCGTDGPEKINNLAIGHQSFLPSPLLTFQPSPSSEMNNNTGQPLKLRCSTAEEKEAKQWRGKLQSMLHKTTWDKVPLEFFIDEAVDEVVSSTDSCCDGNRHRMLLPARKVLLPPVPIPSTPRESHHHRGESICESLMQNVCNILF